MGMKIVRKIDIAEALEIGEGNLSEIKAFIGDGIVEIEGEPLQMLGRKGMQTLEPGLIIVKYNNGACEAFGREDFEAKFLVL